MNNHRTFLKRCETEKKYNLKIIIYSIISILVLLGTIGTIIYKLQAPPKFIPPDFESTAIQGYPNPPEELGYTSANLTGDFSIGMCGVLEEKNKNIPIYFTNIESNSMNIKLQIFDKDNNILTQTGLIKPGEYIEAVTLNESLPEGETNITIKIMGYEPDTYYSAGFTTMNIDVTHKN